MGCVVPHPAFDAGAFLEREQMVMKHLEEYNSAADLYYDKQRANVIEKPFRSIQEVRDLLKFALVLSALKIGINDVILDFGAGTCWTSLMLNRMGCRTISLDVSRKALELGKALFDSCPFQKKELNPRFEVYDGRHFPLPDGSVDIVLSVDAFHHVPNQEEILGEMYRVLKEGGQVALVEPGHGAASTPHSREEEDLFGVLESEVVLPVLHDRAIAAGFTDVLILPWYNPGMPLMSWESVLALASGKAEAFEVDRILTSVVNYPHVILRKGERTQDSAFPGVLKAIINPLERHFISRVGGRIRLQCDVMNAGDTLWISRSNTDLGVVRLGVVLCDENRRLIERDYLRLPIPRDVAPGDVVRLEEDIPLPARPGVYLLRLDMVDEGITWFAGVGSEIAWVRVLAAR